MRDFQWMFNQGLADHIGTPLLVLAAAVALMILAAGVLVARALRKQRAAAQAAEAAPAQEPEAEIPPC